MKLLYHNYIENLLDEYRQAKEVLIVSPYVTLDVVHKITSQKCSLLDRNLTFITLPPGEEYIDGSSDPKAILALKQAGFSIYLLERLHAKIYMFDRRTLYLGSANLTSKGVGSNIKGNREILVRYKIKDKDADELIDNFINDATEVDINESWIDKIQNLLKQIDPISRQENYEDILNQIRTSLSKIDAESKQIYFLNSLQQEGVITSFQQLSVLGSNWASWFRQNYTIKNI